MAVNGVVCLALTTVRRASLGKVRLTIRGTDRARAARLAGTGRKPDAPACGWASSRPRPGIAGVLPHGKAMRDSGSKPGALQLTILGGSNRID
ncbi:response regulator [Burkholderia pseudomallei TSV44]|nr:response regulator [Burkholderia pseudomallei MSHR5492]KGX51262.1 response regulator [Burkholderia pseudomallei TSV44]